MVIFSLSSNHLFLWFSDASKYFMINTIDTIMINVMAHRPSRHNAIPLVQSIINVIDLYNSGLQMQSNYKQPLLFAGQFEVDRNLLRLLIQVFAVSRLTCISRAQRNPAEPNIHQREHGRHFLKTLLWIVIKRRWRRAWSGAETTCHQSTGPLSDEPQREGSEPCSAKPRVQDL